jgi:hypothetical protein
LKITPAVKGSGALLAVTFKVKNTGSREGAEVAQVYVADSHAPSPRPPKELKRFAKVSVLPGETKQISVLLDRRAFSYYGPSTIGTLRRANSAFWLEVRRPTSGLRESIFSLPERRIANTPVTAVSAPLDAQPRDPALPSKYDLSASEFFLSRLSNLC